MEIYLKALGFIFLAEMGDKTQVLAMVLATRYKLKDVLFGIMIGSFVNHGLAIFLGMGLMQLIPMNTVQIIAGVLFILFSYWTLKYDSDEDEEEKTASNVPMIAVAILFFVGELGDKTQLTAVTLAMENGNAFLTLLGTVTGMMVTSGIGIALGLKFGKVIQEHTIKYVSSAIFLLYGLGKLISLIENNTLIITVLLLCITIYMFLFKRYTKLAHTDELTVFQKAAEELYLYKESMKENVDFVCKSEVHCGKCSGSGCSIGYLKNLIKNIDDEEIEIISETINKIQFKEHTNIEKNTLRDSLLLTIKRLEFVETEEQFRLKNEIRKTLELILYGRVIQENFEKETYFNLLKEEDRLIGKKSERLFKMRD